MLGEGWREYFDILVADYFTFDSNNKSIVNSDISWEINHTDICCNPKLHNLRR